MSTVPTPCKVVGVWVGHAGCGSCQERHSNATTVSAIAPTHHRRQHLLRQEHAGLQAAGLVAIHLRPGRHLVLRRHVQLHEVGVRPRWWPCHRQGRRVRRLMWRRPPGITPCRPAAAAAAAERQRSSRGQHATRAACQRHRQPPPCTTCCHRNWVLRRCLEQEQQQQQQRSEQVGTWERRSESNEIGTKYYKRQTQLAPQHCLLPRTIAARGVATRIIVPILAHLPSHRQSAAAASLSRSPTGSEDTSEIRWQEAARAGPVILTKEDGNHNAYLCKYM